jgi:predicted RNase H-like HicB family nuclease
MDSKYTAVIKKEDSWWIGWIAEVPGVNCQERTKEELVLSLKEALKEAIEFNRREALKAAGESYQEEKIGI